jgi:hypothetical protein
MTKTQKKLLVTAAVAGLVAGAVATAKNVSSGQYHNLAGKAAACDATSRNGCPGCGGKTNTVAKN